MDSSPSVVAPAAAGRSHRGGVAAADSASAAAAAAAHSNVAAHVAPASRSYSTPILAASWHSSASVTAAAAAPAAAARASPQLSATALHDLSHSVQSVLPLCTLPLNTIAQLLSGPTPPPDTFAAAVQAAAHVARAPRGGGVSGGATESSGRSAGALHRLLMGLLWILEHVPFDSASGTAAPTGTAHPSVVSSLIALRQLSLYAPLRSVVLTAGGLRIVARVALDAWARADAAAHRQRDALFQADLSSSAAKSSGAASARDVLAHALGTLLVLTDAPSEQALHPLVAALLNKLGAFVVVGPAAAAAASAAAGADTSRPTDDAQADPAYLVALSLLGNFVCSNPAIHAFVKSNPHSPAGALGSTGTASECSGHACSTSVSTIPLKSLYRKLISCLSSPALGLVLHALRLVSHLAVNDSSPGVGGGGGMESRLFNRTNMEQTFQLVFNLVVQTSSSDGASVSQASGSFDDSPGGGMLLPAVDILATLCRSPSLLAALAEYTQLQASLKQLVRIVARQAASASTSSSGDPSSAVASAPATARTRAATSILVLLRTFAESEALAPAVTRLLLEEESADILVAVLPLCGEAHLAQAALALLQRVVAQGLGGDEAAGTGPAARARARSEERYELSGALRGALVALAPSALHTLAQGTLSPEAVRAAADADALAEREAALLELALRPSESGSAAMEYGSVPPAAFLRSLSSGSFVPAGAPSAALAAARSDFALAPGPCSHRDALLGAVHLFQTLFLDSVALRGAVSPSLDVSEMQGVVLRALEGQKASPGASAQHAQAQAQAQGLALALALAHLLSLFGLDASHEAEAVAAFFASLQRSRTATTDLAAMAGASLALSPSPSSGGDTSAEGDLQSELRRRCVEDALHVLRIVMDAAVASVPAPRVEPSPLAPTPSKHAPHPHPQSQHQRSRSEASYRAQVGTQVAQTVSALARGIQAYNGTCSRDVAGLQSALAAERARGGALAAALAEARSGAGAAALAQGERERGLQVRLADAEARLAQEQSRRANEAAEAASAHAHQLAELQSRLESAENERAAQRSLHHERLSAVESELQAALSRASGLEDAQRDSAARFQTLAAKLKQGGQAYEAQLNYGTKLAAENAALRAEAEKQLGAQAAQIASCTAQLRESQSLAEDLTRRVEDAYAKMVLLNRALVAAQERGDRAAQAAEEHAQRGALLAAEMAALRQAHERLRGETERRDAEAQALRAQLDASRAEHARAEQQRDAQAAQLEAQLDEMTAAERAASAQAARLDESLRTQRARTQSLEQQAAIAARAAAEQASRLDAAEAELQKHHQLAAMIHKLSGQAALPIPAPSAGAGANNHA